MRRISATLLALLLVLATTAAAEAAFPGRNGVIAFSWFSLTEARSQEIELRAIQTVGRPGSSPRTVIGCEDHRSRQDGACEIPVFAAPAFSPDGRWIAFDAGPSLALVRPNGDDLRLLPARGDDGEPAFSPDGRRLAFSSGAPADGRDAVRAIWVAARDGTRARMIVRRGSDPAWSTRGWVAYVRAGAIFRVRADGSARRRLTRRRGCSSPAWSPHGTKLAFACRGRLWVTRADGRRPRRIRGTTGVEHVAWSPDGRSFAVHVFDSGVWTLRTDGSRARQLVAGGAGGEYVFDAGTVDWQPRR